MKFLSSFSAILAILWGGCTINEQTNKIPAVSNFEMSRYLGTWYEIARYPHSFEQGLENVSATYSYLPNGKIRVINRGINRKGKERISEGVALPAGSADSGELKVSFFRPFYGAYRIIYLSPDYDLAIVTSSTKEYLWILSRRKEISREEREFCLNKITHWGFDPEKLIWVDQN